MSRTWTEEDSRAFSTRLHLIPEGKSGSMEIIQRKAPVEYPFSLFGEEREDADMYRSIAYFDRTCPFPHTFNVLREEKTVWMSDTPQEIRDLIPLVDSFPDGGSLFMSGLGLGILPRMLLAKAGSVTVVERSHDVAELVWDYVSEPHWDIELGDVAEYLESGECGKYDLIYLDTWPSGDYLYLPWVERIKAAAQLLKKDRGKLRLWTYQRMLASLRSDLLNTAGLSSVLRQMDETKYKGFAERWPFFMPFVDWLLEERRSEEEVKARITEEVAAFKNGDRDGLKLTT